MTKDQMDGAIQVLFRIGTVGLIAIINVYLIFSAALYFYGKLLHR